MVRTLAAVVALALCFVAQAATHPDWTELTPLLGLPIESDQVQAVVKKYDLKKGYKFDSGSFTAPDQAYTLMFDKNRIDTIILRAAPYAAGEGDADWMNYSRPLPADLKASDTRKEIVAKLGKPAKKGVNYWSFKTFLLWIHFASKGAGIEALWISLPPAES